MTRLAGDVTIPATAVHNVSHRWQSAHILRVTAVAVTVLVVTLSCQLRWSLGSTTPWQCDEIPLLVRYTGLCGHVTNEQEARDFEPSFYSFYMGALRSVRAPKDTAAIHTTTGFWVNLTTHLFGASPAAGRAMPFVWSIVAIAAAAWGGWMVTQSVLAACIAACLVAVSPHAMVYGAQARGYAEAMAVTPLMLIAFECFRRRPQSWVRAVILLICCVQLSLTVYTLWLFWVAPALLLAVCALPRKAATVESRRMTRTVLIVVCASVFSFMALYTIDRLGPLSFTASRKGIALDSPHRAWAFLVSTMSHLTVAPVVVLLLGTAGVLVLWRSTVRWWLFVLGAGVAAPLLFAAINRSAGYPRNFGYLVVPIAILAGAGADLWVVKAMERYRAGVVAAGAAVALIGSAAWAQSGTTSHARKMIEPDWGGAVMAIDREPETIGPRWVCHSLANHWQINWYRDTQHLVRSLAAPVGGEVEIILGTQHDELGREVVYQVDPLLDAIVAKPLPDWLVATSIDKTRSGVAIRRWRGARIASQGIADVPTGETLFVVHLGDGPSVATGTNDRMHRAIHEDPPIHFKPVRIGNRIASSWIGQAGKTASTLASVLAEAKSDPGDIRIYRLSPP